MSGIASVVPRRAGRLALGGTRHRMLFTMALLTPLRHPRCIVFPIVAGHRAFCSHPPPPPTGSSTASDGSPLNDAFVDPDKKPDAFSSFSASASARSEKSAGSSKAGGSSAASPNPSSVEKLLFESFRIEEHIDDVKKSVYFVYSNDSIQERKVIETPKPGGPSWQRHSVWRSATLYFRVAFLPKGYPHSVSADYARWHIWQACQQVCWAFNGVMSTHALLTALGLGTATGATGLAAVVQWVLKDGLGNLGKVLFGWKFGSFLDADAKKWRYRSDFFANVGTALEISSLFVPKAFLPLAVTANLAKGVAAVAGGATRASIMKSFLQGENMADVAAKAESQMVISSLCGMLLGIAALPMVSTSNIGVLQTFLTVACAHMFFNYAALKSVHLPTLNRFRLMYVMSTFLSERAVPARDEVARKESIIWSEKEDLPFLVFGAQFRDAFRGKQDFVNPVFELFRDDGYLATLNGQALHLIFRRDVAPDVILQGIFHASCIQHVMRKYGGTRFLKRADHPAMDVEEELNLLKYTQTMTQQQFPALVKGMREQGWNTKAILVDLGTTRLDWAEAEPRPVSVATGGSPGTASSASGGGGGVGGGAAESPSTIGGKSMG